MTTLALPDGISCENLIGAGTSGCAALDPDSGRVIKFPIGSTGDDEDRTILRCDREAQAYEKLKACGRPESVLDYYGPYADSSVKGIWLQYAPNGSVSQYLRKNPLPSEHVRLRWARQVVQALTFCHSRGILHGDIRFDNFFLDNSLNLKLADFTGASVDGSGALSFYKSGHLLPESLDLPRSDIWSVPINVKTEIFAVGSALYEIWTGLSPLNGLKREEKEQRFRTRDFPLVECPLQEIIYQCWHNQYKDMTQVLEHILNICAKRDNGGLELNDQSQTVPPEPALGPLVSPRAFVITCLAATLVFSVIRLKRCSSV